MNQPARAQEPSMEEILASIRRIIADDDASKAPAGEATQAAPPPPPRPVPQPPPVQQVEPPVRAAPPPPPPPPPPPAPAARMPEPPPVVEEPVAFQPETVAEQSADILDLTESMAAEAGASPQFRTIDASSDLHFAERPEPAPPSTPFPPAPARLDDQQERLLSNAAGAAVDSAFHALAQTVLSQNARTLEDLVRDMLRPMLKSWLDDNLPGMVERMVRAEIERVSRGRPG